MAIIAVVVLLAVTGCCLALSLRMFRIAFHDAEDLAVKLAVPHPRRAADWPEVRVDAVVGDPDSDDRLLVVARWPARLDATVLLESVAITPTARARGLLERWRDADASLSPRHIADDVMTLRCRRTNDAITLLIVRESSLVGNKNVVIER